jgi:hypothetical protein
MLMLPPHEDRRDRVDQIGCATLQFVVAYGGNWCSTATNWSSVGCWLNDSPIGPLWVPIVLGCDSFRGVLSDLALSQAAEMGVIGTLEGQTGAPWSERVGQGAAA